MHPIDIIALKIAGDNFYWRNNKRINGSMQVKPGLNFLRPVDYHSYLKQAYFSPPWGMKYA